MNLRIFAIILLATLLLTGCAKFQSNDAESEDLIRQVIETPDLHSWGFSSDHNTFTPDGIAEYASRFPALHQLLDQQNLSELFKTSGIPLLREYIYGDNSEHALNAMALGDMVQILCPELKQQILDLYLLTDEELIRQVIENSDLESWAVSSGNVRSPEAILEYAKQYPDLYDLLTRDDLADMMGKSGLDMIREYLDRGFTDVEHPEYWLNASALGEMVRILCPELETSLHEKLYE